MAHNTKIEWTHIPGYKGETWNPVRGCRRVSEGCQHCYAEMMAARFSGPGQPYEGLAAMTPSGPRWTGEGMAVHHHLDAPLRWKKPRAVFVNSMSDLFFERFSFETIAGIFGIMAAASNHKFMVLTKRPNRMREFFEWLERGKHVLPKDSWRSKLNQQQQVIAWHSYIAVSPGKGHRSWAWKVGQGWPLPNVWLGVSVENQAAADERIPLLLQTPSAVRFLSCEPLLGPLEIDHFLDDPVGRACCGNYPGACNCVLRKWPRDDDGCFRTVDWVIAGGESGSGARPMHPDWARGLRDQCAETGVPFFFKQWGAWQAHETHTYRRASEANQIVELTSTMALPRDSDDDAGIAWKMERVGKKAAGRELDGRTHSEFPEVSQ